MSNRSSKSVMCAIHSPDPRKHTEWAVSAFDGELFGIQDAPGKKGCLQSIFKIHGTNLMMESCGPGESPTGFHQVVDAGSEHEASALHASLLAKHGAKEVSPMARSPCGAWMGDVTDPWGLRWTLYAKGGGGGGGAGGEETRAATGSDGAAPSSSSSSSSAAAAASSTTSPPTPAMVTVVVSPSAKAHGEWLAGAAGGKVEAVFEGKDGKVMHSDVAVKGAHIYIEDRHGEMPGMLHANGPAEPGPLGPKDAVRIAPHGWYVMMNLSPAEIKPVFDGMVAKGAKVIEPLEHKFWGAQFGVVRDPFGTDWGLHADDAPQEDCPVNSDEKAGTGAAGAATGAASGAGAPGGASAPEEQLGAKRPRIE